MASLLLLAVFVPLLSFAVLAFGGARLGKPKSGYVAVGAISISLLLATIVLSMWLGMPPEERVGRDILFLQPWASFGSVDVDFGVKLDSLTVIMFFMVTLVGTCIFVFSLGYMAGHSDEVDGQSKYHRFFTYLSLFAFSMLGLLVSPSILFLFIFWELVGVCSYFLIGFYFHKKSASDAAIKAFVVNRVGDFGFIIGLMMVFFYLGDLSLDGAAAKFATAAGHFQAEGGEMTTFSPRDTVRADGLFTPGPMGVMVATWMGILLFFGAIGKSAQVPLQVWLPDAMEGPTPVSALIHAATMVAAGVYLVARIFALLTPGAAMFIATIGCITLTIAALIAIVQTDIKRVLAYSTVSQLGYMIFGLGVGAWIAALFHLLTHAFFKALMFLGSGQVIEGCHHEQDMTKMGGLRKKMPVTCWTFLVGVLAIAGTGLPGLGIGLGGYFSKDEILAVAWHRSYGESHHHAALGDTSTLLAQADHSPADGGTHTDATHSAAAPGGIHAQALPGILFWVPVIIAYITPFYMMRCWWMTFMGKPRDAHVYEHAHESKLMYLPLVVLAIGTVVASFFLFRPMVANSTPTAAPLVTAFDGHAHDAAHAHGEMIDHRAHSMLIPIVGFAFLIGFLPAWWIYRNGLDRATAIRARFRAVHTVLSRKFYFDDVYNRVFRDGVKDVLAAISAAIDKYVIDALVNFCGWVTRTAAAVSGDILDRNGLGGRDERKSPGLVALLIVLATVVATQFVRHDAYSQALWVGLFVWIVLGVDGLVNDLGRLAWDAAHAVRMPQNGHVRSYVMWAAGAAAIGIIVILWAWSGTSPTATAALP